MRVAFCDLKLLIAFILAGAMHLPSASGQVLLKPEVESAPLPLQQLSEELSLEAAANLHRELFTNPSRDSLKRLKASPQHGIALRAAWEEVLLESRVKREHEEWVRERRVAIAKFIGFIEGRLHTSVPEFWEHGALQPLRVGAPLSRIRICCTKSATAALKRSCP
ncbi:MAG: hypothetical protein QM775_03260 [Pirellulales bacterium]